MGECLTLLLSFMGFMILWALLRCQFGSPGLVPLKVTPPPTLPRPAFCKACQCWKPARAHHSRHLDRCVFRMDHVCPWINNVVGYSNQKFFILFLAYVIVFGVFNLLLLVASLAFAYTSPTGGSKIIAVDAIAVVVNITGVWVVRGFLSEQMESIESNVTLIETFQGSHGDDSIDVFRQLFGENPWLWFIPVYTTAPPDYSESVFPTTALSAQDADSLGVELTDGIGRDKCDKPGRPSACTTVLMHAVRLLHRITHENFRGTIELPVKKAVVGVQGIHSPFGD